MKKLVLAVALLIGTTAVQAQSSTQDHINNTVKYEMSKLKDYHLTATQEKALIKANEVSAEAYHKLGPSSADMNAFKKVRETRDAEYKKVLTKEQFAKWSADATK